MFSPASQLLDRDICPGGAYSLELLTDEIREDIGSRATNRGRR